MRARLHTALHSALLRGGALAAVAAVGLTGCSGGGGEKPGESGTGPRVVEENAVRADKQVQLKEAEVTKVVGLPDKNAEKQVNEALRAPLEWAVNWTFSTLDEERKKQCGGRNNVIQTKVLLGLRGEIVTASNSISLIPCYDGEGALPTVPVTVDVKNAKPLTAEDILTGEALDGKGLKKFFDALSGPKDDWKSCELDDLEKKDFLPGKRDEDKFESPAPAGLLFEAKGVKLIWSTTGTDCNNFTFTAPYDKVKEFIKPDMLSRLQASAGSK